jgi:hypothetical protein
MQKKALGRKKIIKSEPGIFGVQRKTRRTNKSGNFVFSQSSTESAAKFRIRQNLQILVNFFKYFLANATTFPKKSLKKFPQNCENSGRKKIQQQTLAKILIIAFYLFVIGIFAVVLNHTLHAIGNDNLSTVNFYANSSSLEGTDNSWSGADRILGAPEVADSGTASDFNSGNSAVYAGGAQSLIAENFTTSDFIKNSIPTVVTSTPEVQPVLENNKSTTTEQNISSSTPADNSSEQNVSTPASDNSSGAASSDSSASVQDESSQPAADNSAPAVSPAEDNLPAQVSAPAADDNSSATVPVEENHLPEAGPATSDSGSADSSGPVSFLQDLKNIAAVGKQEIGKTLLGQMVLADSKWGSDADDRNILFGPFASAKIKISVAAIKQAAKAEQAAASSSETEAVSASSSASSTGAAVSSPAVSSGAPITIWYSFSDQGNGDVWNQLGAIDANTLANADRGGYLAFDAPFLNDWRDLDNLRIKFSGADGSDSIVAYLDSVWVEVSYQNGSAKTEVKPKDVNKDKLDVDGKEINFTWTDDNSNENLIIKSDKKDYFGLTNSEMYFSVENTGVRAEDMNFQFYFPATSSSVVKINELIPDSPYLTEVPQYQPEIYDCSNGWDKRGNIYSCYPTGDQHACDEVSPNRRYCRMSGVMTGTVQKIQYADRWQELGLADKSIAPQEGVLQKLLGLGPQVKTVPNNFVNKKATAESVTIAPGEVKYFKATLGFKANSSGEFYIEAVGSSDGYGLLDPWWDSGWNYRLPITVNNISNPNTLTDYQLYLEMSSSTSPDFWRHIKSDGSDIRFANANQTAELPYWIQSFNHTASSAKIWIKVDSIPAASSSQIYLYYGNSGASSASDQFAPFTYSSLQNIFYTASSSPSKTINVISLVDGNQVQVNNGSVINLNRQQIAIFTGFSSSTVIKTKGPIMTKLSNGAGLESAVPIAFFGSSFVIPSDRGTGVFNFYSPFAANNAYVYNKTTLMQTVSLAPGGAGRAEQNISADGIAIVESDQPMLFSYSNSAAGDSLLGYPTTNRDLYGVKSQYDLIGGDSNTSFSIICSSHSSTTVSLLPEGDLLPDQVCSGGAKGMGDAVRIQNVSGTLNAIQQDEGTSSESTMFLPFKEFSSEYMLPTNAAHIAVVCASETGVVDLSIYDQNNNFVSSSTCSGSGIYPGKAYFGAADATTYLAGSRIVSTNGQPFYAYYKDTTAVGGGAETNLFGAVQTRNFSSPDAVYAIGAEEIEGPPTGVINSAVEKSDGSGRVSVSIGVNDLSRDNCRAKIEYVPQIGGHCNFATPLKPALDESSSSAEFGSLIIANKNNYQLGTSTGFISTASGLNHVSFNWLSKNDLPAGDGIYCLRLTANDNISNQTIPATTTVMIDNTAPTVPGNLSLASKTGTSATLKFSATSTDSNFKEYKIYYKIYDGTPATTADNLFGSSSDINLASVNFNHATTTVVTGLATGLKYTFDLFAYDAFGNFSKSAGNLDMIANTPPAASFNSAAEKTDGSGRVDISFTANDADHDNTLRAKLEYQSGSKCDFSSANLATIETDNITASFGTVSADNSKVYRLGTTSNFILTSPGANTINFDWLSHIDTAVASGTYCLRLTANDGTDDQISPAEIVVVLDNVKPVASGNLQVASTTETSIKLNLPTTHLAQDNNEPATAAYKIFYKVGTSGVTQNDSRFTAMALNAYNFNGSSSVIVGGLSANTHYVFNIWAYDSFGNTASATEVTARTDAELTNKSLQFVNPEGTSSPNIAVADNSSAWNFRARVSDVDGSSALSNVTLGFGDSLNNTSPFSDLKFTWTKSSGAFAKTGADVNNAASVSPQSTSTCAGNYCTVDFQIIFNKTFASTSVNYSGELYSTDASLRTADDVFNNIFQIRKSWIDQEHYRWRNNNGGG